jgi:hypothetical protein
VTVEYLVLGMILIAMGAVQIWLRHFAGGADGVGQNPGAPSGRAPQPQAPSRRGVRSGRVWEGWTRILGFLGLAMGIVLVILGALGR